MRAAASVHEQVALRLAGSDQRYTPTRQAIVATLASAGRPLSIPEILASNASLPQSSAYRTVTALMEAGVVRRVAGIDDHARFELAEELAGHHHHLACGRCGTVEDVSPSPRLERAMAEAARVVAEEHGYAVTGHQFDLVGVCPSCQVAAAGPAPSTTVSTGTTPAAPASASTPATPAASATPASASTPAIPAAPATPVTD